MLDLLYPWFKALHVISVIAWMAGLFYLPRLFVYHAEKAKEDGILHETFSIMEAKLLRLIMNPAMIAAWIFGLLMVATPGYIDWSSVWPWSMAAAVLGMSWFHGWCAKQRKLFAKNQNAREGRYFRMMNEVPTVLLVIIVVSVIVRPF